VLFFVFLMIGDWWLVLGAKCLVIDAWYLETLETSDLRP